MGCCLFDVLRREQNVAMKDLWKVGTWPAPTYSDVVVAVSGVQEGPPLSYVAEARPVDMEEEHFIFYLGVLQSQSLLGVL